MVNPGALVYGTLTVGALLAAESAQQETYAETVGAVVLALVLYWVAFAYADFTGQRLSHREPLEAAGFERALLRELPVLAGAAVPLLALVVLGAFGASLESGVTAAIWISAAMVLVIELVAGVRADLSGPELAIQTALGTLLGLGLIALKLILH